MFEQGKSNKDLANLIGVTETHAAKIRNGKASLQMEELFQVAKWLNVKTDELAEGFILIPASQAA